MENRKGGRCASCFRPLMPGGSWDLHHAWGVSSAAMCLPRPPGASPPLASLLGQGRPPLGRHQNSLWSVRAGEGRGGAAGLLGQCLSEPWGHTRGRRGPGANNTGTQGPWDSGRAGCVQEGEGEGKGQPSEHVCEGAVNAHGLEGYINLKKTNHKNQKKRTWCYRVPREGNGL